MNKNSIKKADSRFIRDYVSSFFIAVMTVLITIMMIILIISIRNQRIQNITISFLAFTLKIVFDKDTNSKQRRVSLQR